MYLFSPILVLKCEQGFVGLRQGTTKLECNKATYETIVVERAEKGIVYFKGNFIDHDHCVLDLSPAISSEFYIFDDVLIV